MTRMKIRITEVEPWPISLAREDLSASVSLYYYSLYGLELRELLEMKGPYEFSTRDLHYSSALMPLAPLRDPNSRRLFRQHRSSLLSAASYQLVLSCHSVFEFLVANMILFLYLGLSGRARGTGFRYMWNSVAASRFLADSRISDIEDDDWMLRNHRQADLRKRVTLLDDICSLKIRSFSLTVRGRKVGWPYFLETRRLRHSVAHTSARFSLYTRGDLRRKPITAARLFRLEQYFSGLLRHINHQLYAIPIIKYVHAK